MGRCAFNFNADFGHGNSSVTLHFRCLFDGGFLGGCGFNINADFGNTNANATLPLGAIFCRVGLRHCDGCFVNGVEVHGGVSSSIFGVSHGFVDVTHGVFPLCCIVVQICNIGWWWRHLLTVLVV